MELLTSPRYKDYCGGLILVIVGLAAAFQAQSYQIGTLTRMGPGFFPAALGIILAAAGAVLLGTTMARNARNAVIEDQSVRRHPPEWRGWACICLAVIAFAVLGELTGLVPATFTCVFIAALGDRDNSLRDIVLLSIGVTIAGVAVFWWGLGILFPLFSRDFM
ncbi:tripartite tricarboxylate transporter TctB family protein [Plastoroseomonas hellenica]|uniref:tripartite tricarboxylate transporter TctB family protein n=1 Tax=Plastoroseomonas hellenica TaxID=2687306 RepID=UPI001BAD4A9D|nr:tripartite tricarboxylate transporter TctB family protein [Plastoroseomonas hellenica]MBR0642965.1 tripartite tricarboxylate transporter TctB family protein [Plastoroseomonas hellenica]